MILADTHIRMWVNNGQLVIDPFDNQRVQPASYDVALGNKLRIFNTGQHTFINPMRGQADLTRLIEIPDGETFVVHPGEFILAGTVERVEIPSFLAGRVEGKSSLGRVGLVIHATAGWLDPGFRGVVTLEMGNVSPLPIILTPGMPIGQIAFMQLTQPANRPYGHPGLNSKYQDDKEPAESKLHQEG